MAIWHRATASDRHGPLPPHSDRPAPQRLARMLERVLLVVGLTCLGYYGFVSVEAALYQAYETRELNAILASAPSADVTIPPQRRTTSPSRTTGPDNTVNPTEAPSPDPSTNPSARPRGVARPAPGSAIGRIEIPRLGVSAIVRAGSDARTLRLAVGHIPGTALPGETGNIGLAAHRDTFFRRLGDIRADDSVRLITPEGTFLYRVEGTQVVEPQDTWVLNDTDTPVLTLVTCFPFRYIGSAPQRFIVRARLTNLPAPSGPGV